MRYSILLASSLAVGALARPHLDERSRRYRVITETAIETVTVLVTVTLDANLPTPGASDSVSVDATPTASSSSASTSESGIAAPGAGSISFTITLGPSSMESMPVITPGSDAMSFVGTPTMGMGASSNSPIPPSVVLPAPSSVSSAPPSPSPPSPGSVGPQHVSGPSQATLQSGPEYQAAILYHHNAARANHGAGEMTWCADCETAARTAAERCTFEHFIPDGVNQGQNLFTVSGDAFNVTAGITESWYKAELPFMDGYYGAANLPDSVFHQVGHFNQLVWIDSTSVGCVSLDCGDRMIVNGMTSNLNKFTVCNYNPAGNINELYGLNVLPPMSTNLGRWDD